MCVAPLLCLKPLSINMYPGSLAFRISAHSSMMFLEPKYRGLVINVTIGMGYHTAIYSLPFRPVSVKVSICYKKQLLMW